MEFLTVMLSVLLVFSFVVRWWRHTGPKSTGTRIRLDPPEKGSDDPRNTVEAELARRKAEGYEPSTPFDRAPVESLEEPEAQPQQAPAEPNREDGHW